MKGSIKIISSFKEKGYDRNYIAMTLEGASFFGGVGLIAASGAVAVFINNMTGSIILVGLAVTLQALCLSFGQLIGAPLVHSLRNIPKFLFTGMVYQRTAPLLMALPLFLYAGPYTAVSIFLVLFGLFWVADGMLALPWGELAARALKPELRGHMMGMQVAIGGGVSLLTGLLLAWLLATPVLSDHYRFGFIFVLTFIVLFVSVFFIRMVKDPKPNNKPEKIDYKKYYYKLPSLIKENKILQRVLIARIPGYIGFSAITFMVVFGANTLDISDSQISWLVYAQIVGGLLGGIVCAEVSRRIGNKAVILLCNTGVLMTLVMAISLAFFPSLGYIWLIVTCTLASLWANSWLGYFSYILDIAPRENRPAFQMISNCIGIPFSFVGYAIGAIINEWGYAVAFVLGCITAIIAIIASVRLLSRKQIRTLDIND